jgi:hypothetical protein
MKEIGGKEIKTSMKERNSVNYNFEFSSKLMTNLETSLN